MILNFDALMTLLLEDFESVQEQLHMDYKGYGINGHNSYSKEAI